MNCQKKRGNIDLLGESLDLWNQDSKSNYNISNKQANPLSDLSGNGLSDWDIRSDKLKYQNVQDKYSNNKHNKII